MADYYATARDAKKKLENTQKENKRNRERIADITGVDPSANEVEHPLNLLEACGRPCRLHKCSAEAHAATNRQEGLIPWNDQADNLIDRFDVRSMLDFYRDPPPSNEHTATGDPKLLQLLDFERYRDLVKYAARGLKEEQGLVAAEQENIEARAQARVAATAALRVQSHQAMPGDATAAGSGPYSAVGFSYGGQSAAAEESSSSSGSEDDSDEMGAGQTVEEAALEDAEDAVDDVAEAFGIEDFSYRLQRALQQEGEEDARKRVRRKRTNRRAMRERERRMAGQGLDAKGSTRHNWHDPLVTNAPSAYMIKPRRPSRSRSRSKSPDRRQGREAGRTYISQLGGADDRAHEPHAAGFRGALPFAPTVHSIDRKAFERDDNIIDAMPDAPDPAMSGAQPFPRESAMQNIRLQQESQQRREGYRRRGSPSKSRSRSRDRYRRRSRSRSRDWDRRYGSRRRSRSSSSSSKSRSRSRTRSPRHDSRSRPSTSSRGEKTVAERLKTAPPVAKAPATETPQERMKRIMAAQLNKQAQKDAAKSTEKQAQAEKERLARMQMERLTRQPRRGRSRSRSRSPPSEYYERRR